MLADEVENIGNGKLTDCLEVDASIKSVFKFIEIHFADFSDKIGSDITASEKALTDKLCKYLNRRAGSYPFYFHHENVEDHGTGISAQTDIGTLSTSEQLKVGDRHYGEFDSFFSMEAKRLPTPGHNREKEYVIGHGKPSGGIERFKKGIHAKNLKYSAIIGYVQKEDFKYWFLQINGWIDELINSSSDWLLDDKLKEIDGAFSKRLAKFESQNLKISIPGSEKIKLFHFWITLVNDNDTAEKAG